MSWDILTIVIPLAATIIGFILVKYFPDKPKVVYY